MKTHLATLLSLIFILLCLCCCEESSGTGTLKITLIQNSSKSLVPETTQNRIVKYNLTGNGPGKKTFSKDSSSKIISIEGLANGKWSINASAIISNGDVVANGSKDIQFSGSSQSEIIEIETIQGSGKLAVNFSWDATITNPSLSLTLESLDGTYKTSFLPEVKNKDVSFDFSLDELKSGQYILKSQLLNGNKLVCGRTDSISIVNSLTTSGSISFKSTDSYNSSVSLQTSEGYTLSGSIKNMDESLIINNQYTASFTLSSTLLTADSIYIAWYEDGQQIGQKQKLSSTVHNHTFVAQNGNHFISVLIYSQQAQTIASGVIKYCGYSDNPEGSPVSTGSVRPDNASNIRLDESTIVGCLPGNKILILTPNQNTMQLCHIEGTSFILDTDGTYTTTMEGYSWIPKVKIIETNPNASAFIAVCSDNTVVLLKYNSKKNTIEIAKRAVDDSKAIYEGRYSVYSCDFSNINAACVLAIDSTTCIFFSDQQHPEIFEVNCTDGSVTEENLIIKPSLYYNCNALGASEANVVFSSQGKLLHGTFDGSAINCLFQGSTFSDIYSIYKIRFINDSNFIVCGSNKLKRLQTTATVGTYTVLGDVNITSSDVCLSPDSKYLYACSDSGNIYSYATDYLGKFKLIDSLNIIKPLKQVIATSQNIISLADDGTLFYFDVAKEI